MHAVSISTSVNCSSCLAGTGPLMQRGLTAFGELQIFTEEVSPSM